MAKILLKTEGLGNPILKLHLGTNRVGRSPDCDFQIEHQTISSHHCDFVLADNAVLLRDCGSTNGVFVDGKRVKEAVLATGQTVHLGDVELFVETAEITVTIPKYDRPIPAPPVVRKEDGSMMCERHPESPATHRCTHCHEIMCDACVHRLRRKGGKLLKLCPLCSYPCEPIGPVKARKRSFLDLLKETVRLPFVQKSREKKPARKHH